MLCSPRTARGAASLAVFTSGSAPEGLGGHAFAVGWKRSTLDTRYHTPHGNAPAVCARAAPLIRIGDSIR
eukprot:3423561-Prymnesium_polylepis.1